MRNRYLLIVVTLALALLYFPLNQHAVHAHVLANSLDAKIPFARVFSIPYLLLLPTFWLMVIYALWNDEHFNKLGMVLVLAFAVSDVCFLVFPTYMPRPQHVSGLVRFIYAHDKPYNDFPSGHAMMASVIALYCWKQRLSIRLAAIIFSLVVIVSVVLTKQHSIIGCLAGVLLAAMSWFIINPPKRAISSAG